MKFLIPLSMIAILGAASVPVYAQSSGGNGSAPVAGEGPGGSGAGQPSAGPSKTPPGAPSTDNSMMMMKKAAPADPAKDPASAPAAQ